MSDLAWPQLLDDLRAKRDALTQAIDILTAQFASEEERAPERRPKRQSTKYRARRAKATKVSKVRKARTVRLKPETTRASTTATGTSTVAIVQSRDGAILARLKKGPASASELRDAMPIEPSKTLAQRASDCQNALTRLRLKKLVKQVDEGWALA